MVKLRFSQRRKGVNVIKMLLRMLVLLTTAYFLYNFLTIIINGTGRHLGSAVGVVLCLILGSYMIFMPKINAFILGLSKPVKIIGGIVILLALAIILTETVFLIMATKKTINSDTRPVVLVLGCRVQDGRPSLMLNERINAAYSYLEESPDLLCIVSGGKGEDELISEAQCMFNELVNRGISPDRIIMEDKSTNTKENFLFSKKIMTDLNLGDSVIIVTNNFHQLRAQMDASECGLTYGACPSKTSFFMLPSYYLRELVGILYEFIF